MTVSVAWIRKLRDCEELVFVSDSRLSGGARTFDYCPKILTLPRSDCAIAFAGSTDDAYPMMLQLSLAIEAHAPLKRRSMDIASFKTHALKILNSMAGSIRYEVTSEDAATFIFGGYSWIKKMFELWTFRFDQTNRVFHADPAKSLLYAPTLERAYIGYGSGEPSSTLRMGHIAFAGDQGPLARGRLLDLVNESLRGRGVAPDTLDMQPFEVVRDLLRDPNRHHTIDGAPQIVKVYQYMQSTDLGVYWPRKEDGTVFLRGRPKLGYENIDQWVLDPDTLKSEHPLFSAENEPAGTD